MSAEPTSCQDRQLPSASNRVPRLFVPIHRVRWHLQIDGAIGTVVKVVRRIFRTTFGPEREALKLNVKSDAADSDLKLQPGEMVEVKSISEIKATLDGRSTQNGLGFMPGMEQYCGKQFVVLKRVEQIVIEGAGSKERVRRMKNTVILDGLHCKGAEVSCDRSCFYFWREAWVKRVVPQGKLSPHS